MTDERGSVSRDLAAARTGDAEAMARIKARYWGRLARAAEARRGRTRPGAHDPDDMVASAFRSFKKDIDAGGLPGIQDREGVLAFLSFKVREKAIQGFRAENETAKRGAGNVVGEASVMALDDDRAFGDWLEAHDPSPEEQAMYEEFRALLGTLRARLPERLARVLALDLEGRTNAEIAKTLGVKPRTVRMYRASMRAELEAMVRAAL